MSKFMRFVAFLQFLYLQLVIELKDFVYVLKDGMVVEQGFQYDLEAEPVKRYRVLGEFQRDP